MIWQCADKISGKKEELQLLMNTLSTRVANAVVVRVGLKM